MRYSLFIGRDTSSGASAPGPRGACQIVGILRNIIPTAFYPMATTYINKTRREDLIEQYMDCWFDTHSYSTEDAAEEEGRWMRGQLESMNNSQLVAECRSSGWGIA